MEYHSNLKRYVCATYSVSLNFRERVRARYVEHTCRERLRAHYVERTFSADKLISVVVIAIWFRVMTQVVFGAAWVARTISLLFRAHPHIWFHVCIRIC